MLRGIIFFRLFEETTKTKVHDFYQQRKTSYAFASKCKI